MSEKKRSKETDSPELQAQKRVNKIRKFYKDLANWAGTSVFLIALDLFLSHGITWSKFPVFFWGIFIAAEFFEILRLQYMDKNWEDKMVKKHMGSQALPDPDQTKGEDYSEELLRQPDQPEMEKADLSSVRKLKKPWRDEDLV